MRIFRRDNVVAVVVALLALLVAQKSPAQQSRLTMLDFSAGSEMEDYLRVLQIAGKVPLYPWSIRGFSRREITSLARADSTSPWHLRDRLQVSGLTAGPLEVGAIYNSAFPYGANDGAVWAGRGVTTVLSGGFAAAAGSFNLSIDPVAFRAANTGFPLLPNNLSGPPSFGIREPYAGRIDLPQRFGSRPYSRVDAGNTSLRYDSRAVTLGVSNANEWIGPGTEFPYVLGNNAPGFPHIFVGTGQPFNAWFAHIHARAMWGKLYQSAYSPVSGPARSSFDRSTGKIINGGTVRLMTAGEIVIIPRGVPGLELGVASFFHVPNAADEPNASFWRKPLGTILFTRGFAFGGSATLDNQEASAFFRWVFPRSGFEVFGERGFEDQHDTRDLVLNLDHEREYMLGFQKVLSASANSLNVLKGELINYQEPGLARDRDEAGIYLGSYVRQGHTNRGQLLGASAGAGWSAASSLSWTHYSPAGRTTTTLHRIVQAQRGDFQQSGIIDARASDVIIAAGVERMRTGRRADLGAKVEAMQDFNRNFSRDVPNLNIQLTARFHLR